MSLSISYSDSEGRKVFSLEDVTPEQLDSERDFVKSSPDWTLQTFEQVEHMFDRMGIIPETKDCETCSGQGEIQWRDKRSLLHIEPCPTCIRNAVWEKIEIQPYTDKFKIISY